MNTTSSFSDENDLQTVTERPSSYMAQVWEHGAQAVAMRHHYTRVGSLDADELSPELTRCIELQLAHQQNQRRELRDPDIPPHSVLEVGPDVPGSLKTCFCDRCKHSYTYTV